MYIHVWTLLSQRHVHNYLEYGHAFEITTSATSFTLKQQLLVERYYATLHVCKRGSTIIYAPGLLNLVCGMIVGGVEAASPWCRLSLERSLSWTRVSKS
jgi:hypothetical protein